MNCFRLYCTFTYIWYACTQEDGNAAFKASKHAEASEIYSKALSSGACPPAFASVLHANRAAAAQGLGQLADAVADCGRARALDPTYYKASARLAGEERKRRGPGQGLITKGLP